MYSATTIATTAVTLLVLSASPVTSFAFTYYRGPGCRSENLGDKVFGPDQGCQTFNAGTAQSFIVGSTGPVDDTFYAVMFSSPDCNPDTIVAYNDMGCLSGTYGSMQVWNVCEDGGNSCLK